VVISSVLVDVPAGESVITLNLFVPQGTGYGLKVNTQNHGFWRDKDLNIDAPYNFPYDINGLVTITGSNVNNVDDRDNYYYYFYDWNVSTPSFACEGPREEVVVTLIGVDEMESVSNLSVYPVPATETLTVSYASASAEALQFNVYNAVGQLVMSQNVNATVGTTQTEVNVSELAQGVYQLDKCWCQWCNRSRLGSFIFQLWQKRGQCFCSRSEDLFIHPRRKYLWRQGWNQHGIPSRCRFGCPYPLLLS